MAKGIAEAVKREKSHDDMMYMQMQCDAVQPGRGLNNFGFYCGLWIWLSFCLFCLSPFFAIIYFSSELRDGLWIRTMERDGKEGQKGDHKAL